MKSGIANMLAIADLPVLRAGVRAMYEGSIDKLGGNADWDWFLYQDSRGDWVIFDVDGPGCVYNFVQHRYPTCEQPTFRFYFDGEDKPRFEITSEQFGAKPPLLEPLAGFFLGDDLPPKGRGPIRVVRSFVPMPFRRGCRVTSSVKLVGNARARGEGGWGHILYHTYASAAGVETFTGRENLGPLLDLWSSAGQIHHQPSTASTVDVPAGRSVMLLSHRGAGAIAALSLRLMPYTPQAIADLWMTLRWDDHDRPDVEAPLGAFFGNEHGLRNVATLLYGQTPDGRLFCKFPMPFWKSAEIAIENRGTADVRLAHTIHLNAGTYDRRRCGYFRATRYYPDTPVTPGRDSVIGEATGRGQIVAATLTGRSVERKWVSCEGDVRLYLDGNRTPQIESDGSESYACYGWGFVTPGQQNPASAYDGTGEPVYEWSETRCHSGDWIPFQTGFRFGLEAHERNDLAMRHSGLVLYYGVDEPGMSVTDTVDIGNLESEEAHGYRVSGQTWERSLESAYEGADDQTVIRDTGRAFEGKSEFTVAIDPANAGVRLRRRCDQTEPRQRARVYVDGKPVTEGTWYVADHNPHYRWLDSEFDIPVAYTSGKSSVRIAIERVDGPPWSEFRYDVFSMKGAS
jgi:hypothetical protein